MEDDKIIKWMKRHEKSVRIIMIIGPAIFIVLCAYMANHANPLFGALLTIIMGVPLILISGYMSTFWYYQNNKKKENN